MHPLNFYASQSLFSSPGEYAAHLNELPNDVAGLCQAVQGLYLHYNSGPAYGCLMDQERLPEIDLRCVRKMLARILELDRRPLNQPRAVENKLVSYCGSASTLLCAFARHKGIPARKRVGFAAYFTGFGPGNHEVAEIWDAGEARWKLVDPHLDEVMVIHNRIAFYPMDVPQEQFISGGYAWQMCRRGEANPDDFGIGDLRGFWMVRNCLIKDLAVLQELLEEPYINAGLEKFIWMLPKRYLDRPLWDDVLGLASEAGVMGNRLVYGMHRAIAALSFSGLNVLADHVLVEPDWVKDCAQLFTGLPAYLVGIRCPLEVLEQRERARRDRTLGQARLQFDLAHAHGVYDFEVDTSVASVEECARHIAVYLYSGAAPFALEQVNRSPGCARPESQAPL